MPYVAASPACLATAANPEISQWAHLANHLAARGVGFPHQIAVDMPRSAAGSGGQSVTQSEPLLCERSGLTRVFVQQRIWKIILKPGLRSVVEEHGVRGNRAGPGRQTPPKTRRPDRLSRIQIRQGVTPHVLFGVGASSCSSRPPATISLWSSQQRSSGLPLSFADWM